MANPAGKPKSTAIFITWSGERSRYVAKALRSWLKSVIQTCDPWMSDDDIAVGTRWNDEIRHQLEISRVGIVCVTPENQGERWVQFEAGAISTFVGANSYVCPYAVGMTPSEVKPPLSQFQVAEANELGTRRLIETVNAALGEPLSADLLRTCFEKWWPDLRSQLETLPSAPKGSPPKRSSDDMLVEILEITRELLRLRKEPTAFSGREIFSGLSLTGDVAADAKLNEFFGTLLERLHLATNPPTTKVIDSVTIHTTNSSTP